MPGALESVVVCRMCISENVYGVVVSNALVEMVEEGVPRRAPCPLTLCREPRYFIPESLMQWSFSPTLILDTALVSNTVAMMRRNANEGPESIEGLVFQRKRVDYKGKDGMHGGRHNPILLQHLAYGGGLTVSIRALRRRPMSFQ
jgi:hypothetical protein